MTLSWPLAFVFQQPSPQSTGPGSGFFLFQMALIFGIIYFLMIRPKVKKEKTTASACHSSRRAIKS